ncbi:MAG: 30S ribosomal protein S3 [Candidatus Lokiarchaeota archaeon]|nr:30S ribosomal protein S3 [Candidatus Lokiarchaeota archaeon]
MSAVKHFIEQNARKLTIDEFLSRELNTAGYGGLEIKEGPMRTDIVIYASRPGVVIGRRGSNVRELTYTLETQFMVDNPQVEVSEIENPWLNAQVMASRIARQMERGVRFRRMVYWIINRIMRAGAEGCEIIVKGKLSSRRGRYQKFRKGTITKTGEPARAFVDEADDTAILKPGSIGIKVRIMKADAKLPGRVHVKEPKDREREEPRLLAEPEEDKEEKEEEEAEAVEEVPEGITDLEELRELEELDELELVEEEPVQEAPEEEQPEATEEEKKEDEEPTVAETDSTLEELEELDELDPSTEETKEEE